MSDYATPTNNVPTILNPVIYFRISAFALAAVAVLGFLMNIIDGSNISTSLGFGGTFLQFTYTHDVVHLVLAAAAFLFGFGNLAGNTVKAFAIIFGVVYVLLGVVGFFAFNGTKDEFLALTPALNIVHLLLGAYALTAGFASKFD